MAKSMSMFIGFILTIAGFSVSQQSRSDRAHNEWLRERYEEATSIKEGMTRADLRKLFVMDGGLDNYLPERYVLKSGNMIKVDVKFDVPENSDQIIVVEELRPEPGVKLPRGDKMRYVPDEQLKIKSVSRPYLEPAMID